MSGGSVPIADPLAEAKRITLAASGDDTVLRMMGGVAIALRCPSAIEEAPLRREYADLDTVGLRDDRESIGHLLTSLGYEADVQFNLYNGQSRLLFHDTTSERHVDVFLDPLQLCHELHFAERLTLDDCTLSLTDLLLSKLQIVETDRKDLQDIVAILADHTAGDDERGVNAAYLARLAADDWGLWRTMTLVLERVAAFAAELDDPALAARAQLGVDALTDLLQRVPKSRRWKLRSRVGEHKRWYDLPEEPE
jgi:hypothetical protein